MDVAAKVASESLVKRWENASLEQQVLSLNTANSHAYLLQVSLLLCAAHIFRLVSDISC